MKYLRVSDPQLNVIRPILNFRFPDMSWNQDSVESEGQLIQLVLKPDQCEKQFIQICEGIPVTTNRSKAICYWSSSLQVCDLQLDLSF